MYFLAQTRGVKTTQLTSVMPVPFWLWAQKI